MPYNGGMTHHIAVFGSRGWVDPKPVDALLAAAVAEHGDVEVLTADGRWIDKVTAQCATARGVKIHRFFTDFGWDGVAGPKRRNNRMLDALCDVIDNGETGEVIVFVLNDDPNPELERVRLAARASKLPGRVVHATDHRDDPVG